MKLLTLCTEDPSPLRTQFQFTERGGCIGRSSDCDWVLGCNDQLISRRHALISFHNDQFWVTDLSSNGIFLDDRESPLGCGNSCAVGDGVRLRIGHYTLVAKVLTKQAVQKDTTLACAESSPSAHPELPADPPVSACTAVSTDPLRGAGLTDAFCPPKSVIPEDWHLALGDFPESVKAPPAAEVSRRLSALQQAASSALWSNLVEAAGQPEIQDLTPTVAAAVARSLRCCIETLIAIRAEYAAVERRLCTSGAIPSATRQETEAERICRRLLDEQTCGEQAEEIESWLCSLPGHQARLIDGCSEALTAIAEQFAPEKFDARWREARQSRKRGDTDGGSDQSVRNLAIPFTRAGMWRFYRSWHRQQQAEEYAAMHQLFRNKLATACQRARKEDAATMRTQDAVPPAPGAAPQQEAG